MAVNDSTRMTGPRPHSGTSPGENESDSSTPPAPILYLSQGHLASLREISGPIWAAAEILAAANEFDRGDTESHMTTCVNTAYLYNRDTISVRSV